MIKLNMVKWSIGCILFLNGFLLLGQVESIQDTIEVSSGRIPLKVSESGRSITVITAEQIQAMPSTSIDDLLQLLPGIEVQSRNAFGAQGDITMRGSTFTQVLLLVDGMRLNDPLTSHFNSNIPVAMAEIDRIEVIRGAASSMYGADAVGGVINIITKAFANGTDSEVAGSYQLGENRLVKVQQGFSFARNGLFLTGGFDVSQSDGQRVTFDPALGLDDFNNFFDIKTMGLAFGWQLSDKLSVKGRVAYDDRDFSARYFYTTSTFDKSVETVKGWWNHLQLKHLGNQSATRFDVTYKNNTDEFVFSPDFPSTNNHTTQRFDVNVNHLRDISNNFKLNVGAQIDYRDIVSNDRGDHQDWHTGLYAIGALQANDDFNINLALRLDNDDNYGTELSPQVNLAYDLGAISLRAGSGRSVRAADYTERYVSTQLVNLTPGRSLGNAALAAESSWSHEVGADWNIAAGLTLQTTAFLRSSANLIDFVSTASEDIAFNENLIPGESYFLASNVTEVQTQGLEFILNYNKRLSNKLHITGNLSYTTIETTNEEDVISVYISSHAGAIVQAGFNLIHPSWSLGFNGLTKNRTGRTAPTVNGELADSYGVWNMNGSVNIKDGFGLNLQIHNLFDAEYQDILGAPMPGRWVMAGFRYRM